MVNEKVFPGCPIITTGPDAYAGLAQAIQAFGHRALLLGGQRALLAGLPAVKQALAGRDIRLEVREFAGECTSLQARQVAGQALSLDVDLVLGMGGGRALDTAKAAAHWAGLPVITLPTIPATCAAVTALSVLHDQPGTDAAPFLFLDSAPRQAFLHTGILCQAPEMYLRAGIGDSLAKAVESTYKATGHSELGYTDLLGLSVARFGYDSLLRHGAAALMDMKASQDSAAFRLAVQACVVNTGLVSLLVQEDLNGALAHSLYYALLGLPAFAGVLHGDAVAWGSLVQLMLQGKRDEALELKGFLRAIGTLASLGELGLSPADVTPFIPQALMEPDMRRTPRPVSVDIVMQAITAVEQLSH